MKAGKIARKVWKVAKPVAKRQARKFMASKGDQMKVNAKGYLGKKTDALVDRGADRIGIKSEQMRGSAKSFARKGVSRGVDMGAAYVNKKLAS
jgi:hypothetical protein